MSVSLLRKSFSQNGKHGFANDCDVCNMNCHFQKLYSGEDGYVVRCKECGHYQLAYLCVMVTLDEKEFRSFRRMVQQQYENSLHIPNDLCKCVIVQTPAAGTCFLFTKREIKRFTELLDEADTEERAQVLFALFRE